MASFSAVLVDYDEDLFAPPTWVGEELRQVGIDWIVGQYRTPESVLRAAAKGDVVMVQSMRQLLTRVVLSHLQRCCCLVRLGIGYDSVDVAAATEVGIPVCNTPAYCIDDVADHAVALLLGAVRHLARQDPWIRDGRWDRRGSRPARRIKGRTLGLLGFGRIARAVAERMSGFSLTLLAYDPYLAEESISALGVHPVSLDELLIRSDFISVHCPLTDETNHLLDARAFGLMRYGVFVVNTSRGAIIEESALGEALRVGKVWGAGLDVFEREPLPIESSLRKFDNLICTPHVGANSEDSVADLYRTGIQIANDACYDRWPQGVVNPEVRGRLRFPMV